MTGLIVDNFAGGGGASTGIEAALGRAVDIAINHDEQAIRMHEANHPGTRHIRNNIWQVDPREVTAGQPVELAWFSPDCKHFSKAKGGKPREKSIRDLAWVVVLWAQRVKPSLILLENVEEFRTWGPLCDEGKPIASRKGETFDKWCRELRRAGYKLQFRELRACDYGAPTIRKRFFMIARCDGQPIVWPEPTHGKPGSPEVESGQRKPWRTAAEIIDWSIPCPSIFERKKPLAEKTLRRIAHGIVKFVLDNPRPFIVDTAFKNTRASRVFDLDEPTRTQTSQPSTALVTPYFARTAHGDVDKSGKRRGQPCHGPEEPFPTVTQSRDSALIVPHVTKFRNGAIGHDVGEPLATVTANSFVKRPGGSAPLGVVSAALISTRNGEREGQAPRARSVEDPAPTVTAKGSQGAVATVSLEKAPPATDDGRAADDAQAGNFPAREAGSDLPDCADAGKVAAFMQKFAENGKGVDPGEPLHTVMAGAPRHAIVCAHLEQANGGPNNDQLAGRAADAPLSTVATTDSQQRLVTSNLVKLRGTCAHGQPVDEPLHTVSAGGTHMAEVRAFLIKYYGNEQDGHGLDAPIGTVTVQDRFGLVTVTIEGEEYVIVDIGMRMLTPRELFDAQGFPHDHIIDRDANGAPITKTAQVAKCGNSVCPPLAEALTAANAPSLEARERAVA